MNVDIFTEIDSLIKFLRKEKLRQMNENVREDLQELIERLENIHKRMFDKLTK